VFLKYYFVLLKLFENYVVEKGRAGHDNSNNKDTCCWLDSHCYNHGRGFGIFPFIIMSKTTLVPPSLLASGCERFSPWGKQLEKLLPTRDEV
jgi:hypothetical protein